MKPRIAIPVPNSDAEYSSRTLPEYKAAVEATGGEAIEIPLGASNAEIAQLLKKCDGILLPGSVADVDPQKYGAARHEKTAKADPARDNVDELALQDAYNMRKPLFGICYGVQSLNVWRQGTLVQHLETPVAHTRPAGAPKTEKIEHAAVLEPASRLEKIVAAAVKKFATEPVKITVNSSHHQALDAVGDGLKVVARSADDGVIEAVEGVAANHWVVGVQWHPERMVADDAASKALFKAFIDAAREWHEKMARSSGDFETARNI